MLLPLPRIPWLLAGALVLLLVGGSDGLAQDASDGVRGDLPPAPEDLEHLLTAGLTADQARVLFDSVQQLLGDRLGDEQVSEADLWLGAVQGMIDVVNRRQRAGISEVQSALPPSVMVVGRDDADLLVAALHGEMTGIGIEFQLFSRHGILVVSRILPGSPAEAAGMLVGDRIVALDGQLFAGLDLQDVLGMLQGGEGSRIALQFQRGVGLGASNATVSVERSTFELRTVADELRSGGVGYVRIFQFSRGTPDEVAESLDRLTELGADRFVLDLRNSYGGDIAGALGVADLFLPEGTVLGRLVEPGVGEQDVVATRPVRTAANLVLLLNAWTHGAAEAVAAALQEHSRAYLIGEPTMGSARTETLVDLGHSLVLRLDSIRMLTPTGESWQGRGVLPDQPFWTTGASADESDQATGSLDPLFDVAVHYLESEGL